LVPLFFPEVSGAWLIFPQPPFLLPRFELVLFSFPGDPLPSPPLPLTFRMVYPLFPSKYPPPQGSWPETPPPSESYQFSPFPNRLIFSSPLPIQPFFLGSPSRDHPRQLHTKRSFFFLSNPPYPGLFFFKVVPFFSFRIGFPSRKFPPAPPVLLSYPSRARLVCCSLTYLFSPDHLSSSTLRLREWIPPFALPQLAHSFAGPFGSFLPLLS